MIPKENSNIQRTVALYNMIPSTIWSVINLAPICIYCFTSSNYTVFYIFLAVSLIPAFVKNAFLNKLQIGKTAAIYKKLGVHIINKVAQNGVIVNKLVKRKFPDHKVVTNKKQSIAGLIGQTYVFEKFHLILFVFFSFTTIYAFIKGSIAWGFTILLTNILYNIYPNLLQQYIRLKLKLFYGRTNGKTATKIAHE
ncbi:MAG: hypothetical protein QM802_18145 [Agriterribacter sp.]